MKVAVVGIGYWGPNLVRNFINHQSINEVCCYDISKSRLEVACDRFPVITTVETYDQILNDPMIQAVAIATPVATHFDLARQALECGKHVFVEKPLTATVKEAQQLIDLAQDKSLRLMVDHIFVYNGAVKKIKEIIESGEIGEIMYFDAVRINLGLFQHDVNVIWDLAPHDLSILGYLCDKNPEAVSAIGKRHFGELEDIAYLTLLYEKDCIAHLHANWLAPVKMRIILIGGTQKMIVYDEMETTEKVKVYDKGVEVTGREGVYKTLIQYRTGDVFVPTFDTVEPLACAVSEFVNSIENNAVPLTDGHSGLRVVRILEAAERSIKENGAIIELHED
ncbi:MAG: Gfo/Idh/MocA family oxidoreductase [bacterium]